MKNLFGNYGEILSDTNVGLQQDRESIKGLIGKIEKSEGDLSDKANFYLNEIYNYIENIHKELNKMNGTDSVNEITFKNYVLIKENTEKTRKLIEKIVRENDNTIKDILEINTFNVIISRLFLIERLNKTLFNYRKFLEILDKIFDNSDSNTDFYMNHIKQLYMDNLSRLSKTKFDNFIMEDDDYKKMDEVAANTKLSISDKMKLINYLFKAGGCFTILLAELIAIETDANEFNSQITILNNIGSLYNTDTLGHRNYDIIIENEKKQQKTRSLQYTKITPLLAYFEFIKNENESDNKDIIKRSVMLTNKSSFAKNIKNLMITFSNLIQPTMNDLLYNSSIKKLYEEGKIKENEKRSWYSINQRRKEINLTSEEVAIKMRKERFNKFNEDYAEIKKRINTTNAFPSLDLAIYILKDNKEGETFLNKYEKTKEAFLKNISSNQGFFAETIKFYLKYTNVKIPVHMVESIYLILFGYDSSLRFRSRKSGGLKKNYYIFRESLNKITGDKYVVNKNIEEHTFINLLLDFQKSIKYTQSGGGLRSWNKERKEKK